MVKRLGPRAAERRRMERKQQEQERLEREQKANEPRALDPMLEKLREYMLAKPGCEEDFPFGPQAMVIRVVGKICAIIAWEEVPVYISLKCDPAESVALREKYSGIDGAYHMNKRHWHSVAMDGSVDWELACRLMDQSYTMIVETLPKRDRERLRSL